MDPVGYVAAPPSAIIAGFGGFGGCPAADGVEVEAFTDVVVGEGVEHPARARTNGRGVPSDRETRGMA